jgi:nucleotide-binding universal stress UspA family protein
VADRVVRYAHCPVLVARRLRENGHVVAATDLTEPSLPAVEAGLAEARLRGGGLTVLHVLPLNPIGVGMVGTPAMPMPPPVPPELMAETVAEHTRRITSELKERFGESAAEVAVRVAIGPPAATIVSTARSIDAELVTVGTRGRTGLKRVLLGSVAEEVVRTTPCSVMAVRLREE